MALFLLIFDVFMLLYHENFILSVPRARRPLGLLCMTLLVICIMFDLMIFIVINSERDRQRRRDDRRMRMNSLAKMLIIIVFVGVLAYFYNRLPYWINFCILLVISSFWIAQSAFAIMKNAPKRFLAVDYFLVQCISKYGPAIYFFGCTNFMNLQTEKWYLPTMICWFGV